jgi:NADPH:quinone reductase-like Zn-dependent oxidoreductase
MREYRKVVVYHLGGPDVLQLVSEGIPELPLGGCRVRTLAAGVSYADLLMREGVHPETPRVPFVPGWDLVGVVDKVGDEVTTLQPGQKVAALPIVGGYAEYICLPEKELVPVPDGLDRAKAASLVLNYVIAYQLMHRSAKVSSGQRVLIHAAAGGVGTALLELGQLAGLEMYGTASSRNHDLVISLGGTPTDYRHVDFVEEILRLTGNGVDAVFDGIGGRTPGARTARSARGGG